MALRVFFVHFPFRKVVGTRVQHMSMGHLKHIYSHLCTHLYAQIPAGIKPGKYVLQWRWDCEESDQARMFTACITHARRGTPKCTQIWASCSDVTITG